MRRALALVGAVMACIAVSACAPAASTPPSSTASTLSPDVFEQLQDQAASGAHPTSLTKTRGGEDTCVADPPFERSVRWTQSGTFTADRTDFDGLVDDLVAAGWTRGRQHTEAAGPTEQQIKARLDWSDASLTLTLPVGEGSQDGRYYMLSGCSPRPDGYQLKMYP